LFYRLLEEVLAIGHAYQQLLQAMHFGRIGLEGFVLEKLFILHVEVTKLEVFRLGLRLEQRFQTLQLLAQ